MNKKICRGCKYIDDRSSVAGAPSDYFCSGLQERRLITLLDDEGVCDGFIKTSAISSMKDWDNEGNLLDKVNYRHEDTDNTTYDNKLCNRYISSKKCTNNFVNIEVVFGREMEICPKFRGRA